MQFRLDLGRSLNFLMLLGLLTATGCGGSSGGSKSAPATNERIRDPITAPVEEPPGNSPGNPGSSIQPDPPSTSKAFSIDEFNNQVYTQIPGSFAISFTEGSAPQDLQISFNGKEVTPLFTITDSGASIAGRDLWEYLVSGTNTFGAKAGAEQISSTFSYEGDVLSIVPITEKIYTAPPDSFTINFLAENGPQELSIFINDIDVTGLFSINEFSAKIPGAVLQKYFENGNNNLTATSGLETDNLTFKYDSEPPRVIVTNVEIPSGKNIPDINDTIIVNGIVRDVSPIRSLKINASPAQIDASDNSFRVQIRATKIIEVVTIDVNGQRSSMEYLLEGQPIDNTMQMKINESVLDFAMPIVKSTLRDFALNKIDPSTPVMSFRGGACISGRATCKLYIEELRLGNENAPEPTLNVKFLPVNKERDGDIILMDIEAEFAEVRTKVRMHSTLWRRSHAPIAIMDMTIPDTKFSMRMGISVDPSTYKPVVTLFHEHPIKVDFDTIKFEGLDVICGDYFECVSGDALFAFLEAPAQVAMFKALFEAVVPPIIDQVNNPREPQFPKPPPVPKIISFDSDLDGKADREMVAQIWLRSMTSDVNGDPLIELSSHFYVEDDKIPATYPHTLGSVNVSAPNPVLGPMTADNKTYDVGLSMSVNMLNQLFLALYQTGIPDTIPIPLTSESLGEMGGLLAGIGYGEDADLEVRMQLGSVPYLRFANRNTRASSHSVGIIYQMDNVRIFMNARKAEEPEFELLLAMVMDIRANIEMDLTTGNYLTTPIGDDVLELKIVEVMPTGLFGPFGLSPELVQSMMGGVVSGAIKQIQDGVTPPRTYPMEIGIGPPPQADQAFPIPLPMDIGVIMRQFEVDQNEGHLVMAMDLLNDGDIAANAGREDYSLFIQLLKQRLGSWPQLQ